jgi:hypothetical protein
MGVNAEMFGDDNIELPFVYRGIVEDIDDPEKAGRVRIRVFGVHSDNIAYVQTKHLPWAVPATSIGLTGGGLRNIGSYKVPEIGSHVYIFFEAGDHNFPVYFAAAPAIEDVEDYHEKDGQYKDGAYEYNDKSRYDDKTNYDDECPEYRTPSDDQIKHPVQDHCTQTRLNTFGEGGEATIPPPKKDELDPLPIFPQTFFQTDIRIAFDGKANFDAPGYDGIHCTKSSSYLTKLELEQELDAWSERKWGFNDDDKDHQHDYDGGESWKPDYPMCSTERNAQGEIVDTDILKERRTYIHPSKYFHELIQLDATRKREDFLSERAIKNVYERQRGVSNSPESSVSTPQQIAINGESNAPTPIESNRTQYKGRGNNEIEYDSLDNESRQQMLARFEERRHNPGREKTVIEDFVYRFYLNKVNETLNVDRNTRFYAGNDNVEIEHGDRNYRLHRGSHNQHIDEGNYNRVVNKGWEHLHIDEGHHFIEIGGTGSAFWNSFEVSSSHEGIGNPQHCDNQHGPGYIRAKDGHGADKRGCNARTVDAGYAAWSFVGENDCGNQFVLMHKGSQIYRLVNGHQHFHLLNGHQKYHLEQGNQSFHLQQGDQVFELSSGSIGRWVNGRRITYYSGKCIEDCGAHWFMRAASWFKIKAPTIILDGNVLIKGELEVERNVKCGVIDSPGGINLIVGGAKKAAEIGGATPPVGTASVPDQNDQIPQISASGC